MVRLWHATTSRLPDPALGVRLGADVRARDFGLVGYTMAFSATLGAALQRVDRYDHIVSDALVVELEPTDGGTWVRLDVQPELRAFRPAADARAPFEFGALATAFLLSAADLVSSDPSLTGYLDRLAEQTLTALGAERAPRRTGCAGSSGRISTPAMPTWTAWRASSA